MTTYSVYLPPEDSTSDRYEALHLIPDSKSVLALLFPPLWLVWNRLWLALMVYAVVITAIILIGVWQPNPLVGYLSALPGLYLMLEGYELVRGKYENQGWYYAGIVEGETREEAEHRFLLVHEGDISAEPAPPAPQGLRPLMRKPAVHGIFPE